MVAILRDLETARTRLLMPTQRRAPWPPDFPPVGIDAAESAVKKHPAYAAAKAGDAFSSLRLVKELADPALLGRLNVYRGGSPILLPVHGIEGISVNTIPLALGVHLSEQLGFALSTAVVQITKAGHTGATGWWRLCSPALFSGVVEANRGYILVDDFIGMGGTFASLRGLIESKGGRVLCARALTGKPRSATLALQPTTLQALRGKHGDDLERWWQTEYGYGFDALTESEALYLLRAEHADAIRRRLAEAAHERHR